MKKDYEKPKLMIIDFTVQNRLANIEFFKDTSDPGDLGDTETPPF